MNAQILSIHLKTCFPNSINEFNRFRQMLFNSGVVFCTVVAGMGKSLCEPGVRQCYLPHLQQSPTVFEQPKTDDCQNKDTLLQKGQTRVVISAGGQTLLMKLYQE